MRCDHLELDHSWRYHCIQRFFVYALDVRIKHGPKFTLPVSALIHSLRFETGTTTLNICDWETDLVYDDNRQCARFDDRNVKYFRHPQLTGSCDCFFQKHSLYNGQTSIALKLPKMGLLHKRNHAGCILLFSMVILSVQTALIHSSNRNEETKRPRSTSREIVGIWPITKLMSLLGPTVSIYIYHQLYNLFEKHGPLLSARFQTVVKKLNSNIDNGSESGRLRSIPQSSRKEDNPFVLKIANEVIRITNMRLREKAVVSRIQMDDDQYELSRRHAASDVARVAINVLEDVLKDGCGAALDSEEKLAVQSMIKGSIAQYSMNRSWHNRLFRVM